jgi:hypothetical protein
MDEHRDRREDDQLDPASYAYWEKEGFRGRPPWRRGDRWWSFAVSLGLVGLIVALLLILRWRAGI